MDKHLATKHIRVFSVHRWQSHLPDTLFGNIVEYVTTRDRLLLIERTCMVWYRSSAVGWGWTDNIDLMWLKPKAPDVTADYAREIRNSLADRLLHHARVYKLGLPYNLLDKKFSTSLIPPTSTFTPVSEYWASCRHLHLTTPPLSTDQTIRIDSREIFPNTVSLTIWMKDLRRFYLPPPKMIPLLTHLTTLDVAIIPDWAVNVNPPSNAHRFPNSLTPNSETPDNRENIEQVEPDVTIVEMDRYRSNILTVSKNNLDGLNLNSVELQMPAYENLESLVIASYGHLYIHSRSYRSMSKLTYLSLSGVTPSSEWLLLIKACGPTLLSLHDTQLTTSEVSFLLTQCPLLKELSLAKMYGETSSYPLMHDLGQHFLRTPNLPPLHHLEIRGYDFHSLSHSSSMYARLSALQSLVNLRSLLLSDRQGDSHCDYRHGLS